MIGEEPPPLPFPSLPKTKAEAKDILDAQRNPTSPPVLFNHYQPSPLEPDKKPKKTNKKSCDICKKKKLKCDNNATPDEVCKRASCQCKYHVSSPSTDDDLSMESNIKYKRMSSNELFDNKPMPNVDIVPSTTVFRKPGLLPSGHYAGETSICGYMPPELQPSVIIEENSFPTLDSAPTGPPYITEEDQLYLIDVYYENLNPFFPIINKQELLIQLNLVMKKGFSYLSPLFFYALFARAAHVQVKRTLTQYDQQTFHVLGEECILYASALVNCYKDKPRVSTVLALIIMANHLEQTKLPQNLTRSWLWAGEAFRLALDLGVHRSLISENNDQFGQLCIRTFWLAYITDCTISMTYGRPSATEEKVLDVTSPRRVSSDDDTTAEWIQGLNSLISLSKIANRVIKFNYCPPPPFKIQGPVKRHNAFLASVDSWITDIMHPSNEPDSPTPNPANLIAEESITSKRFNFQKKMFLYTNLILLHRPYVNDFVQSRNSTRPSYDICAYSAVIITDIISKLESNELIYHSKSPMTAYALVMALRIHIMNASTNLTPDKFNSERNFAQSIEILEKLPQCQVRTSLLYNALTDLREQYQNRFNLAQEREQEARSQLDSQEKDKWNMTSVDAILNSGSFENNKRKERPNSNGDGSGAQPSTEASNIVGMPSFKPWQPENTRKKPKSDSSGDKKGKRSAKPQNDIQKSRQHKFSATNTNTTTTTTITTTAANFNHATTSTMVDFNAAGQQPPYQQDNTQSQNYTQQTQDVSQFFGQLAQNDYSQYLFPPNIQPLDDPFTQPSYLPSPQTFDSASPAGNVPYNNFDFDTLQQQQRLFDNPDVQFSIDQIFSGLPIDEPSNLMMNGDALNGQQVSLHTWDVRNENNFHVSITPAETNNRYNDPSVNELL